MNRVQIHILVLLKQVAFLQAVSIQGVLDTAPCARTQLGAADGGTKTTPWLAYLEGFQLVVLQNMCSHLQIVTQHRCITLQHVHVKLEAAPNRELDTLQLCYWGHVAQQTMIVPKGSCQSLAILAGDISLISSSVKNHVQRSHWYRYLQVSRKIVYQLFLLLFAIELKKGCECHSEGMHKIARIEEMIARTVYQLLLLALFIHRYMW